MDDVEHDICDKCRACLNQGAIMREARVRTALNDEPVVNGRESYVEDEARMRLSATVGPERRNVMYHYRGMRLRMTGSFALGQKVLDAGKVSN